MTNVQTIFCLIGIYATVHWTVNMLSVYVKLAWVLYRKPWRD
jgi:hypothetical protein